jgi:hypothetical protein
MSDKLQFVAALRQLKLIGHQIDPEKKAAIADGL